jgi:hypothetical protein
MPQHDFCSLSALHRIATQMRTVLYDPSGISIGLENGMSLLLDDTVSLSTVEMFHFFSDLTIAVDRCPKYCMHHLNECHLNMDHIQLKQVNRESSLTSPKPF